jgi:sporulation protein YlmC with PRC-barrel domain
LSKLQKEKSLTKDKLIGMKVIDAEGKLVGTVKDVGFTIGKAGISLTVEDSTGEIIDVSWDSIQGAVDFVVLKPVTQVAQVMPAATIAQPVTQMAQPVQQQTPQSKPLCPTCNQPLTYIQQYQRWYCYNEKKYV